MSDPIINFVVYCTIIVGVLKGLSKLSQPTIKTQGSANILDFLFNNRL